MVDETQMPKPQEYTDIFILIKNLFLVGVTGLQSISNPVERPCMIGDFCYDNMNDNMKDNKCRKTPPVNENKLYKNVRRPPTELNTPLCEA